MLKKSLLFSALLLLGYQIGVSQVSTRQITLEFANAALPAMRAFIAVNYLKLADTDQSGDIQNVEVLNFAELLAQRQLDSLKVNSIRWAAKNEPGLLPASYLSALQAKEDAEAALRAEEDALQP